MLYVWHVVEGERAYLLLLELADFSIERCFYLGVKENVNYDFQPIEFPILDMYEISSMMTSLS